MSKLKPGTSNVSVSSSAPSLPARKKLFGLSEALPLLLAIAAATLCYGLLINRGLGLPILGYNVAPAERVMQGELPYRDFLYNYTPGVLWLNAALMKIFGATLMTVNAGLFVFKLAALIALFYVARRLTCSKAALIPVALTLAWVGYRVVFRVYPTQYSMLFVLLGLAFMLSYDETERARWLALSGAMIGLVFLFKQNVGVFLLASATAAIFIRGLSTAIHSTRWTSRILGAIKRAAFCWAGFAIVTAAMFGYIAYTGTLGAMMNHFFSLAGEYGEKRAITLPHVKLLAPAALALITIGAGSFIAVRKAPKLFEPFILLMLALCAITLLIPGRAYVIKSSATAVISYLPIALFIITFAFVAWQYKTNHRVQEQRAAWWRSSGPIVMTGLFALGAYLEMYPRADYAHLVRVLPPVFLLLLLLTARSVPMLTDYFQGRMTRPRRAAVLCAAAPVVLLFVIGIKDAWQPRFDSHFRFVEQTPLTIERARGILVSRKQANFIQGLDAAIETSSAPGDYIFSFAPRGTAFYFLSARRNPTRFVWWRSVGIKKSERDAFLEQIENRVSKLILIPEGFANDRVLERINDGYHRIAEVGDIAIYDRNE
ncbi:MAG TPA: glycosyltransferase family 39 protein [Blastocatellia bacterium]|nr:glycosyltransferase family 39 protein [Blastocatellia bacterium]